MIVAERLWFVHSGCLLAGSIRCKTGWRQEMKVPGCTLKSWMRCLSRLPVGFYRYIFLVFCHCHCVYQLTTVSVLLDLAIPGFCVVELDEEHVELGDQYGSFRSTLVLCQLTAVTTFHQVSLVPSHPSPSPLSCTPWH